MKNNFFKENFTVQSGRASATCSLVFTVFYNTVLNSTMYVQYVRTYSTKMYIFFRSRRPWLQQNRHLATRCIMSNYCTGVVL